MVSLVDCLVDNPVSGLEWLFCLHARMVVILQKGPLSHMLREINGLKNRTQNRHQFLLISSTKYEILLASWPLTVALMCAVAM